MSEDTPEQKAKREADTKAIAEAFVGIIDWMRGSPERTAGGLLVAGLVGAWLATPAPKPTPKAMRPRYTGPVSPLKAKRK